MTSHVPAGANLSIADYTDMWLAFPWH